MPCSAEEEDKIFLDADEVRYEDSTGVAHAEGNVRARNKDMRLYAPAAKYDSESANVTAYSDARNDVVLISNGQKLVGKQLDYNLVTRHGVLTDAHGKMDAMYMQGRDVKVMPIEDAERLGIIKRSKKHTDDQMVAEWLGVTSTTCDFPNPHYKFVSKQVVMIPGKKTIIKNPKIYIGKFLLFTYPFDYIIRHDKRASKIAPIMAYDSEKGGGFGISGELDFGEWGEASLYGVYWTNSLWEAKLRYQKEITEGLTAFIESDRLYDKDDDDIMWRPKYGLHYDRSGWAYNLQVSERELIQTEMTPGQERRFNVWSKPEFRVTSPWYTDPATGAKLRFIGVYGRYQENTTTARPWIDRWALAAQLSGSFNVNWGIFKPYYGASYMYFDYDGGEQTQKVTDATVGVSWNIGDISFNTRYFRRWVEGNSKFSWDRYANNENIYQTISFPLPIGASWEKWTFSVTGTYNMITDKLAQMYYYLTYNKHCIT
ncbi:MAG: hypothetical protein Q4F74_08095, partial [Synergistaceae bacterium]|nr:hypothetical protein [Synergistaceae bacterium]